MSREKPLEFLPEGGLRDVNKDAPAVVAGHADSVNQLGNLAIEHVVTGTSVVLLAFQFNDYVMSFQAFSHNFQETL
jgi:hypothetical protein